MVDVGARGKAAEGSSDPKGADLVVGFEFGCECGGEDGVEGGGW